MFFKLNMEGVLAKKDLELTEAEKEKGKFQKKVDLTCVIVGNSVKSSWYKLKSSFGTGFAD